MALVAEDLVDGARVDLLKAFIEEAPYPEVPPDVLTEEYWVSVEEVRQPCNPVEVLIAELLQRPDVAALIGEVAGAQWSWHDYLDSDAPKAYHTDCNRRLVDCSTVRTNPQWSSVVYLTDEGGGTVVWRRNEFVAVQPRRGRYLVFQGDLPHGVLWANEPKHADRIVLSITWWHRSEEATGSRDRPTWPCDASKQLASPDLRESELAEEDLAADKRLLTPVRGAAISAPFSAHREDWCAQRMPSDLCAPRKDGEPPEHMAVLYADDGFDADWCPLVSHALR